MQKMTIFAAKTSVLRFAKRPLYRCSSCVGILGSVNHVLVARPVSSSSKSTSSAPPAVTLGLLRENYDKWERRTPLTPSQCSDFLQQHPGSKILVQPSSHRIFSNTDYERAGAVVQEDLRSAQIIFGVKRPRSLKELPSEKTYLFFSHVIKGQPENMVSYALVTVCCFCFIKVMVIRLCSTPILTVAFTIDRNCCGTFWTGRSN